MALPHPPARRARLHAVAALGCAFLLSGCLRDIFFPPDKGDPPRKVLGAAFGKDRLLWIAPELSGGVMQPVLDGSRVYFGGAMPAGDPALPALIALDRGTGELRWRATANVTGQAALAAGRVASVSGSLALFDTATGTPVGAYADYNRVLNGGVASDGARFYATSHDGRVLAIDGATAQMAWQTPLVGAANLAGYGVAVSDDAVAAVLKYLSPGTTAPDSGIVAVVERANGAVRWRAAVQAADPGIVRPPVIVGDVVIVVTQGHDVRALDVRTGAPRWQADVTFGTQELSSNGLAACDGLVFAATGDLGIVALDAATGAERWRRGDLQEGSMYDVQCSHGTVMAPGHARLQLFDAATGAPRGVHPAREPGYAGHEFRLTGVVRDERYLYIGTSYGAVKVAAP